MDCPRQRISVWDFCLRDLIKTQSLKSWTLFSICVGSPWATFHTMHLAKGWTLCSGSAVGSSAAPLNAFALQLHVLYNGGWAGV
mmetsp:Transcript_18555/g.29554  ORF Transcript_18555/g.29554 Transcript_18555/m.29554 type:complete len:84 (-) Transcript_18555:89-340(-)